MKTMFKVAALMVSVGIAFVCFTVNVGIADVGGVTGTIVVQKGTSQVDIQKTQNALRIAGAIWTAIALGCLAWISRRSLPRPINEKTPDVAIVHNNRGWEYYKRGDLDRAITEYQQAVAIEANYPEAWNNLGLAFGARGLNDQAISCLEKAIVLAPRLASARNDLAIAYFSVGRKEAALANALKAQELGAKVNPEFMQMLQ